MKYIGIVLSRDSEQICNIPIYEGIYLKIKRDYKLQTFKEIWDKFQGISNIWEFLGSEVLDGRLRSLSSWSETCYGGSSRTIQGIRCKKYKSCGFFIITKKRKDIYRQKHVDRYYARENMIRGMKFYELYKKKFPQYGNEVRWCSVDCASVKKIGTQEGNNNARNTRRLILRSYLKEGNVKFICTFTT